MSIATPQIFYGGECEGGGTVINKDIDTAKMPKICIFTRIYAFLPQHLGCEYFGTSTVSIFVADSTYLVSWGSPVK